MELDPAACYRAFASRDRRFDGRFFAAVLSTGIYCRPGCPARLPRPRNVRFFACAAAAEEAGFRPCLRCRPETAPGSPAWLGTSATASRALRLIADGQLDHGGVGSLAARLGVGARHLRRLFAAHVGASPLAVAGTRRAHFARRLLDETDLPMSEIAVAAGFGSTRRFNHAIRDTFRRTPGELRRARGRQPHADGAEGLALRLPCRPPLDWDAMLAFLGARAIPGVEAVEDGAYRRTIEVDGVRGSLEARALPGEHALALRLRLSAPRELIGVAERAGRLFDLHADTAAIAAHLARDPLLRRALAGRAVRVPSAWDPFELAVRAVLGQQVSVRGAVTLAGRLVRACGAPLAAGGGLTHLFPSPARLAEADLAKIGLTRARARALRALATAVRDRTLRFDSLSTLEEAVAKLAALPGIGAWTAHVVAMRALGEPDAFPAGDLGVRRALARGGELPSARAVEARAEAWRPWRAYAVMALWTRGGASHRLRKESR